MSLQRWQMDGGEAVDITSPNGPARHKGQLRVLKETTQIPNFTQLVGPKGNHHGNQWHKYSPPPTSSLSLGLPGPKDGEPLCNSFNSLIITIMLTNIY